MERSYFINLFNTNMRFYKKSKIQRLIKSPRKLIYSKILQFFAEAFEKPIKIKAKTFWGEDMIVVIPEVVSLNIYRYAFFEESSTKMILEYLKPGMSFIDIGAHYGYFTLLGSLIVGNEGQIHSFEPSPRSFNILKTNILNKRNIILNNCAVSSKRKIVLINDYGIKYSAFNSIYNARLPHYILQKLKVKKYKVTSVSIDDYVDNNSIRPNFIKIDAESSEYEIILGMVKTIDKFQPIISIEVGDMGVKGRPKSKDLINFLINRGYQPFEFKGGKLQRHTPKNEQYQYDNILFLPN